MKTKKTKMASIEHKMNIDVTTGELLSSKKCHLTYKEQEPPFVKMYLTHIATIYDLPKSSSSLLLALAKRVTYDNVIQINKWLKATLATELKIKEQSISNAIVKFTKVGVLKRIGSGTYQLNPYIFAKGKWEDVKLIRADWLELVVTYLEDGTPIINDREEPNLISA